MRRTGHQHQPPSLVEPHRRGARSWLAAGAAWRRSAGFLVALATLCVVTGLPTASAQSPAPAGSGFTVAGPVASPAVEPVPSAVPCATVAPQSPLPDGSAAESPLPEGSATASSQPCPTAPPEPCPTVPPEASPLTSPEPSPAATFGLDASPSAEVASPSPQPTPCPSLGPSSVPSASPVVVPSSSPTASPTHRPTPSATPRPARTPRPTPRPTPSATKPPGPKTTPPPIGGSVPQFLTLPLRSLAGMTIEQGWLWVGCCHPPLHGGVDYIKGTRDVPSTWQSFPIVAAAPGRVCAAGDGKSACGFTGVGNHVIIKHHVAGQTWYTYYGHLRTMDPSIPIDAWSSTAVARGQFLGDAGHSGDPCCVVHLHFEVLDSHYVIRDPYDLYATRTAYPDPQGTNGKRAGRESLFVSNPPRLPSAQAALPVAALIGAGSAVGPIRARRLRRPRRGQR